MSRPTDETLLAFLEGTLDAEARAALLDQLDRDEALAGRLRQAATGMYAVRSAELETEPEPGSDASAPAADRRISPWWTVAAAAATLLIAVPVTWQVATRDRIPPSGATPAAALGQPEAPAPSFVLLLRGSWPDAASVDAGERARRAAEYWGWTSELAGSGILVAAGDLRWEPGRELGPGGVERVVDEGIVTEPGFPVGMLALRVSSYDEAEAIARECPHLRYGGSVWVRQVGGGFVTIDGRDDWSD